MSPERLIELPTPLPHQVPILLDDHRFKVVVAGRRFGKSKTGLICVTDGHGPLVNGAPKFRGAVHGAKLFWVAPTFPISQEIWRELKTSLLRWGGELDKSEQDKRIGFPGGGSITIRSASDPTSMRGPGLDGIVIDEAAYCSEDTWNLTLRPTLADRHGWAVFISSPNGTNWLHEQFVRAETDPDYRAWQLPTSCNPLITPGELEAMQASMNRYEYSREILAEFEVSGGNIFERAWFKHYKRSGDVFTLPDGVTVTRADLYVFVTCDFAWSSKTSADYRVYSVWGRTPDGRLLHLHLERGRDQEGFSAPTLIPRLCKIVERWGAKAVFVEASGPLVRLNAEAKASLPGIVHEDHIHEGGKTVQKDKVSRAYPAASAVERGRVLFPEDATWFTTFRAECCSFPAGEHDDQVDTLSLAVRFSPPIDPMAGQRPAPRPGDGGHGGSWWKQRGGRPWLRR